MKIIAFYSFKGGVGRTSALLNVGYLLAVEERANVVLADWDIHAPGLTCLEDLQPDEGAPQLRPGVVDVLASLAEATPESDVLDPGGLVHPTRLGRRVAAKSGGELWLVPAGAFDPTEEQAAYLETVRVFNRRFKTWRRLAGRTLSLGSESVSQRAFERKQARISITCCLMRAPA